METIAVPATPQDLATISRALGIVPMAGPDTMRAALAVLDQIAVLDHAAANGSRDLSLTLTPADAHVCVNALNMVDVHGRDAMAHVVTLIDKIVAAANAARTAPPPTSAPTK